MFWHVSIDIHQWVTEFILAYDVPLFSSIIYSQRICSVCSSSPNDSVSSSTSPPRGNQVITLNETTLLPLRPRPDNFTCSHDCTWARWWRKNVAFFRHQPTCSVSPSPKKQKRPPPHGLPVQYGSLYLSFFPLFWPYSYFFSDWLSLFFHFFSVVLAVLLFLLWWAFPFLSFSFVNSLFFWFPLPFFPFSFA